MKRRTFLLMLIALGVLAACGAPPPAAVNPANPRLGADGLCFDRSKSAPGC